MGQVAATKHPAEWLIARAQFVVPQLGQELAGLPPPQARRASPAIIGIALRRGWEDFLACRSDVISICVMYPMVGLVLGYALLGHGLLPLAFPLIAGFALLGPLFATGLYEMSRRREQGLSADWVSAFRAFRSPAIASILLLGAFLLLIFAIWLGVAELIWRGTMGPLAPVSIGGFFHDVFATSRGQAMLVSGVGIGGLFALAVLATNIVSFPLLLDRNIGAVEAVRTSLGVAEENPRLVLAWGAVVAALLAIGSAAMLIGLAVVMPVLGHATWHLYRQVLPDQETGR